MTLTLSTYYDIEEMHNTEIPHKNKWLYLFYINACSLNKNYDDLQYLLSLNLDHYSFEFTPTETSAGGTLLYTANHLSCKC